MRINKKWLVHNCVEGFILHRDHCRCHWVLYPFYRSWPSWCEHTVKSMDFCVTVHYCGIYQCTSEHLLKFLRQIQMYYIFYPYRVDSNLTVKLTDTALSRDLFPNDYHCLGDNENRPVKWLSLEALLDRRFSVGSEVVSTCSPTL